MFADRPIGRGGWNAWRGVIGGFYLLSALFNGVYTLPRSDSDSTFDGYADGAWFGVVEDFMRDVFMPNAVAFMVAVIVFELVVGVAILGHGHIVDVGVAASLGWVIVIMPFLAWPYLWVNIALVIAQGALVLRRYDTALWTRWAGGRSPRAA